MYENVGTRIPKNMVKEIEYLAYEDKSDKSKVVRDLLVIALKNKFFEIALEKYRKKEISLGKAAELAKIPLADFMKMVAEKKITVNYSVESLEEDFKSALKHARLH